MAKKSSTSSISIVGTPLRGGGFGVQVDTEEVALQLANKSRLKLAKWTRESFSSSRKSSQFRELIKETNKSVADETREKIYTEYIKGKSKRKPYRQGDARSRKLRRYSDGKMDKALKSSGFIKSDDKGIYISFTELGKYARQWARLNFGAQPRGSRRPASSPIEMFGRKLDSPTLSKFGARPGFLTPSSQMGKRGKGFKSIGVSSNVPYSKTPSPRTIVKTPRGKYLYVYAFKTEKTQLGTRGFTPKYSRGIQGWRFIDKGIAQMNRRYGKSMEEAFQSWFDQVKSNARSSANKQSRRR